MILYFRRPDGSITTRELSEAAGVKLRVTPPAGAEPIEAEVALAELDRLAELRQAKREASAAVFGEARRGAYAELLALGLSPAAATAISGHRRPIEREPVGDVDPITGRGHG